MVRVSGPAIFGVKEAAAIQAIAGCGPLTGQLVWEQNFLGLSWALVSQLFRLLFGVSFRLLFTAFDSPPPPFLPRHKKLQHLGSLTKLFAWDPHRIHGPIGAAKTH